MQCNIRPLEGFTRSKYVGMHITKNKKYLWWKEHSLSMKRTMENSRSCCSFPGESAQWPEPSKTVGQWDSGTGQRENPRICDEEISGFPKSSGVVVERSKEQKRPTWCHLR